MTAGLACLALWLAAAVWTDLRQRRIPNALVLSGLVAAALAQWHQALIGAPPSSLAFPMPAVLGALIGGASLWPLYARGGMGAGDVKLMALVGAFVGPAGAVSAVLCALVAGGLQAVLWWAGHRLVLRRAAPAMPYAPAIAVGTAVAMAGRVLT